MLPVRGRATANAVPRGLYRTKLPGADLPGARVSGAEGHLSPWWARRPTEPRRPQGRLSVQRLPDDGSDRLVLDEEAVVADARSRRPDVARPGTSSASSHCKRSG